MPGKVTLLDDETLQLVFSYDFQSVLFVRTLPGRKYFSTKELKYWTCDATLLNYKEIKKQRPDWEVDEGVKLKFENQRRPPPEQPKQPLVMDDKLYPFQREAVEWLEARDGRGLIAHEMGLGKSVIAAAWVKHRLELRPALIICPASLKINWEREINRWVGERAVQLYGTNPNPDWIDPRRIHIVNYDILNAWLDDLLEADFNVIIGDEIQYIRNLSAKRSKAFGKLAQNYPQPRLIALSGTPIVNKPVEFFSILNLLDKTTFPKFMPFAFRYCKPVHNGFRWSFNGATNVEELHALIFPRLGIRRLKKDVLTELPPKRRVIVPFEIDNLKEYTQAQDHIIQFLRETRGDDFADRAARAQQLARMNALKTLAAQGKMKAVVEWIGNFLESGEKLVVFALHYAMIDKLMKEFGEVAVKVDGRDSQKARQQAVDGFQSSEAARLFVGNMDAAGVGLTLTAASNVAFVELGWSPGQHAQAEDRCHRISQLATSVTVYYLISEGTIEEDIAYMIDQKQRMLEQVLEGREVEEDTLLTSLIKRLKGE
ncbi:MAG TPA: DEAD/DEAH box helicase [bacterium]|nr:DEAD/DEAH box helicase [bacterium]